MELVKEENSLVLHILNAVRLYLEINQDSKPRVEEIIGALETAKLILFITLVDDSRLQELKRRFK